MYQSSMMSLESDHWPGWCVTFPLPAAARGEYLLVFSSLAVYVGKDGRKSREREILFPAVPVAVGTCSAGLLAVRGWVERSPSAPMMRGCGWRRDDREDENVLSVRRQSQWLDGDAVLSRCLHFCVVYLMY